MPAWLLVCHLAWIPSRRVGPEGIRFARVGSRWHLSTIALVSLSCGKFQHSLIGCAFGSRRAVQHSWQPVAVSCMTSWPFLSMWFVPGSFFVQRAFVDNSGVLLNVTGPGLVHSGEALYGLFFGWAGVLKSDALSLSFRQRQKGTW